MDAGGYTLGFFVVLRFVPHDANPKPAKVGWVRLGQGGITCTQPTPRRSGIGAPSERTGDLIPMVRCSNHPTSALRSYAAGSTRGDDDLSHFASARDSFLSSKLISVARAIDFLSGSMALFARPISRKASATCMRLVKL